MNDEKFEAQAASSVIPGSEAGVAELMELYETIEGIYAEASIAMTGIDIVYTSNVTNGKGTYGYMGRDSEPTQG